MRVRKIADPYYGRGFGLSLGSFSLEITAGVCDRLIGFKLIATPPFNVNSVNSGDHDDWDSGFREIGVQVSLAWLTTAISIHRWN